MIILHIGAFLLYSAILIGCGIAVGLYVGREPEDRGHT